jgi:hypothetical protein
MLSAPFPATTYAIIEAGFLPLFFRIPWKSQIFPSIVGGAGVEWWASQRIDFEGQAHHRKWNCNENQRI